jgi:membrane protease YdiL (CAAX protease family)
VFTLLLLANGALSSVLFRDPSIAQNDVALLGINAWSLLIPAFLTLQFMIRFIDHVPVGTYGVGFHESWSKDLAIGLAVSAMMLGFYSGFSTALGGLNIEAAFHDSGFWTPWILTVLVLTVSAANEELLFRGYPLQVLMVAIGPWPAMVAMSSLFGLGHYFNPDATWIGTLNTFLAGILLCLAYVRTRSLWFPYGIHIGWNLAIGPILGFPVSGITMPSVWISEGQGADWLMGGAYGPEGGVLGTGVMLSAILAVILTGKVIISQTQRSLLDAHANTVYTGTPLGLDYTRRSERP